MAGHHGNLVVDIFQMKLAADILPVDGYYVTAVKLKLDGFGDFQISLGILGVNAGL